VLGEDRCGANGEVLKNALEQMGLVHQKCASAKPALNTVLVATREPIQAEPVDWSPDADLGRLLTVATGRIRLLATYFPSTAPQIANAFLPLLGQSSAWVQDGRPTLLVGDLNSGRNPGDTQGGRLTGGANFALMLDSGWVDVWRELHPNASEFMWFSDTRRDISVFGLFMLSR
jgi:exonuclease III